MQGVHHEKYKVQSLHYLEDITFDLIFFSSGLWGIVNNAGWATFGEVEWVSLDTYRKALEVNVVGLLAGVKAVLPLIRQARGRVVTITSGLGRMAVPTRCKVSFCHSSVINHHDTQVAVCGHKVCTGGGPGLPAL